MGIGCWPAKECWKVKSEHLITMALNWAWVKPFCKVLGESESRTAYLRNQPVKGRRDQNG